MQQSSPKKNLLRRIVAGLIFALCLGAFVSPAVAKELTPLAGVYEELPPLLLLAMADPPDFLAPAPGREDIEGENGPVMAITPFFGSNQALTLLPTPERPAITASDVIPLERPEITAGVNVDLGTIKFNLGYTLPPQQVDEFVRPLGVELDPGTDVKRFSLGVKIPF